MNTIQDLINVGDIAAFTFFHIQNYADIIYDKKFKRNSALSSQKSQKRDAERG